MRPPVMGFEMEMGAAANSDDEIGEIARLYMLQPDRDGLGEVECNISRALVEGAWDELSKWHRVKLRLQRLLQERDVARRLGCESLR